MRMQAANSTAAEASGRRLTRSLQHVPNLASPSSSSSYSTSSSLSPISSRSLSPSEQPRSALSGRACELSTVSEVAALPHVDSARLRSSVMRPAISTGESTADSLEQVCSASFFKQSERSFATFLLCQNPTCVFWVVAAVIQPLELGFCCSLSTTTLGFVLLSFNPHTQAFAAVIHMLYAMALLQSSNQLVQAFAAVIQLLHPGFCCSPPTTICKGVTAFVQTPYVRCLMSSNQLVQAFAAVITTLHTVSNHQRHVRVCLQSPNHQRHESTESVMSSQSERYADALGWAAPLIHIDGPCGAPAQNYKDYKVLLLVVSTPHLV